MAKSDIEKALTVFQGREQAAGCDVVILATNWVNVPEALKGIHWRGRILIDAANDGAECTSRTQCVPVPGR